MPPPTIRLFLADVDGTLVTQPARTLGQSPSARRARARRVPSCIACTRATGTPASA